MHALNGCLVLLSCPLMLFDGKFAASECSSLVSSLHSYYWKLFTETDPLSDRYLSELLAERNKLNPFMPVLPHCCRLLNQGECGSPLLSPT